MIIGITDGRRMTDKVSTYIQNKEFDKPPQLYSLFFKKHVDILYKNPFGIKWKISKTTGDGVFFYTRSRKYKDCCKSLVNLFAELNQIQFDREKIESRLFFFYCKDNEVIIGNRSKYFDSDVRRFTKRDLFGHQLNYGFRLLSIASGAVIFTEQNFILKLAERRHISKINTDNLNVMFENIKFSKPIPITHLKGIEECGFMHDKKHPKWIWEIQIKNE